MSPAQQPPVLAAGALIWRVRRGKLQVALVHRPRYQDWSWPKGKQENGEHLAVTAVREVAEETGLDVILGIPLPQLRYTANGRPKEVHYWAAQVAGRVDGPSLRPRAAIPRADLDEIDEVRWFDAAAARTRLTRSSDRRPLRALLAAYRAGTLDTRALVIARHARARKRSRWQDGEATRPLTRTGVAQTKRLIPILAVFGVSRVVTSPWERCASTLRPYAAAADLDLETWENLTEHHHQLSPGKVAIGLTDLLSTYQDVVVCTHRPVLPTVLDVLSTHSARTVAQTMPLSDPYLRPGEVLVAHVSSTEQGPRVVAVEVIGT